MYQPKPIDTTAIELPPELMNLVEQLAEHVHDIWSLQRMKDGWKFGPHRDDVKLEHPGLVPYNKLTDSEKEYDRNTAQQTIKAILSLGWQVQHAAPHQPSNTNAETIRTADLQIPRDLAGVMSVWGERLSGRYEFGAAFIAKVAKRVLSMGEPLLAYDLLAEGVKNWPKDAKIQQLRGLALARSGASLRANQVLTELRNSGNEDNETLSLLGRTHKDLATHAKDQATREQELKRAFDCYAEAYQHARAAHNADDAYYAGINAASLALWRGEAERSRVLAGEVNEICREVLLLSGAGDYWLQATLGEAALLRGNLPEAEEWYSKAAVTGAGQYADLSSTRKQARLVLEKLGLDPAIANQWLHIPRVVCFSGHMIDQPGRARPRFPAEMENDVAERIKQRLDAVDAGFGYSSAACGADLLFLEAMLKRGKEINVVLPYKAEQFMSESVDIIPGHDWGSRFRKVMQEAASRTLEVNQHYVPGAFSTLSLEYANRLQLGLASLKAKTLGTDLISMAVWDGQEGDGPGGTAAMVSMGRRRGAQLDIISLATDTTIPVIPLPPPEPVAAALELASSEVPQELVAILFADAVNFSKLTEAQLPKFIEFYLGAIADLKKRAAPHPLTANTWGDGLFMIFSTVRDAGLFGLQLCEYVQKTKWKEIGLPESMNIRIGLHAGPAYRLAADPVTEHLNYIGAHISQAARIEPITPPGNVYASQAFAALCEAEGIWEFAHDYVGIVPLAKHYGEFRTYHVRRVDRKPGKNE